MSEDADVTETLAAVCSGDRPHQGHASWSGLWGQWLCPNCRSYKTDAELRVPLDAESRPARQQPGAPLRVL